MNKKLIFIDLDNCLVNCNLSEKLVKLAWHSGLISSNTISASLYPQLVEKIESNPVLDDLFRMAYGLLAGVPEEPWHALAKQLVDTRLNTYTRPEILRLVRSHQENNDAVVLLSASTRYLVDAVADRLGIRYAFSLNQEVKQGRFTGLISGITGGQSKALVIGRVQQQLGLEGAVTYLYTDSIDDEVALRMVDHPRPTYPDTGLRKLANREAWTIIDDQSSAFRETRPMILIISMHTGSGHQSAAKALEGAILRYCRNSDGEILYNPQIVSLDEISGLGRYPAMLYNWMSEKHPGAYKLYHEAIKQISSNRTSDKEGLSHFLQLMYKGGLQRLRKYRPRLIISVHSVASDYADLFKELFPQTPFMTCVTDLFGDTLPGWANNDADRILAPTRQSVENLTALGADPSIITESGPIIDERFNSDCIGVSREAILQSLGLSRDRITLLVNTGGDSTLLPLIEDGLNRLLPLQMIVLCNKCADVFQGIEKIKNKHNKAIAAIEYTSEMHKLLYVSDFVFTKPGPATVLEALAVNCGILINALRPIMPQEVQVADYLIETGVAIMVSDENRWGNALDEVGTRSEAAQHIKRNIATAAIPNGSEAVCEVVREMCN